MIDCLAFDVNRADVMTSGSRAQCNIKCEFHVSNTTSCIQPETICTLTIVIATHDIMLVSTLSPINLNT